MPKRLLLLFAFCSTLFSVLISPIRAEDWPNPIKKTTAHASGTTSTTTTDWPKGNVGINSAKVKPETEQDSPSSGSSISDDAKKSKAPSIAKEMVLDIPTEIQQTPVWCWAAVSAMVFKYYELPNPNPAGNWQCGVVGVVALINRNFACSLKCSLCIVPAGSGPQLSQWIEHFPVQLNIGAILRTRYINDSLPKKDVVGRIDAGAPVIVGINPGNPTSQFGTSEHVALIVGYDDYGDRLIVNDPYPFWQDGRDPYGDGQGDSSFQGRHRITYDDFVSQLGWRETIIVRGPSKH